MWYDENMKQLFLVFAFVIMFSATGVEAKLISGCSSTKQCQRISGPQSICWPTKNQPGKCIKGCTSFKECGQRNGIQEGQFNPWSCLKILSDEYGGLGKCQHMMAYFRANTPPQPTPTFSAPAPRPAPIMVFLRAIASPFIPTNIFYPPKPQPAQSN